MSQNSRFRSSEVNKNDFTKNLGGRKIFKFPHYLESNSWCHSNEGHSNWTRVAPLSEEFYTSISKYVNIKTWTRVLKKRSLVTVDLTCNATWPAGCSEKGLDPLNHVITAAGRAPHVRHMRLITEPSSWAVSAPITLVWNGRTERRQILG